MTRNQFILIAIAMHKAKPKLENFDPTKLGAHHKAWREQYKAWLACVNALCDMGHASNGNFKPLVFLAACGVVFPAADKA